MNPNQYRCNVRGLYLMDFSDYSPVKVTNLGSPGYPIVHLMINAQDLWYCTINFNSKDKEAIPSFTVTLYQPLLIRMQFASPFHDRKTSLRVIL